METAERERWNLALEIAREHLAWCSHRGAGMQLWWTFEALGKPQLAIDCRRVRAYSVRVAEIATAWLNLPPHG